MSELQRYWAHHTSLETDLRRVRAIECNEVGDYYRAGDVDAARAADKARIEELEAALRSIANLMPSTQECSALDEACGIAIDALAADGEQS